VQVITSEHQDRAIVDIVGRINNRFGYLGFHPVQLFHQAHLDPAEHLALLTLADIFLAISERAAFSIPALEFIACQGKRFGQVVMSEFIGHHLFIPGIFKVNPWDHTELALSLQDALTVPIDEMMLRHEERSGVVRKFGVHWWFRVMITELEEAHAVVQQHLMTPALDTRKVFRQYLGAGSRLFLLDYDGTLTGIRGKPEDAAPSPELLRSLRMLCRDPLNYVYIISGRDRKWLEHSLRGIDRLGLSAEHGCYLRPVPTDDQRDAPEWKTLIREEDLTWKDAVLERMQYYTDRTPGSLIEHKSASLAWHYRLADDEFGQRQAHELMSLLEQGVVPHHPVAVLAGKKNVEVRPRAASKGSIVKELVGGHGRPEFVLCVGDDRTDEDMFRALLEEGQPSLEDHVLSGDGCFTCKVGLSREEPTSAKFGLRSPEQVVALLSRLSLASAERSASHPTF